jgi:O-antigen/teichoic acid export membrane protein
MNVVALVAGLVVVCLAATSPHLRGVVFGERWQPASVVIFPSCVGLLVNGPISVAAAGYLYARGHTNAILVATILHTVAWLAVGLGLYPSLGLVSVGLGSLAGGLVDATILGTTLARVSRVSVLRVIAVPAGLGVLAGWGGLAVCNSSPHNLLGLVLAAAAGGTLFLASMAVLQRSAFADLLAVVRQLGLFAPDRAGVPDQ